MNIKEVTEAKIILDHIDELKDFVERGDVCVKCSRDWAYGSGVDAHRQRMVEARTLAQRIAKAVMDDEARRQIVILTEKLKVLGVNEQSPPT